MGTDTDTHTHTVNYTAGLAATQVWGCMPATAWVHKERDRSTVGEKVLRHTLNRADLLVQPLLASLLPHASRRGALSRRWWCKLHHAARGSMCVCVCVCSRTCV